MHNHITMYRLVYTYVYLFWRNYPGLDVDRFPYLISDSGPPYQMFSRKITHKTIRYASVHTAVRSQTTGGVMWGDDFSPLPWVVLQQLQVIRLVSFTHFLELRDAGGLYVDTRDLPRTMRGKLVVIEASGVLFKSLFVYRVLRVITQRCVRAGLLTRLDRLRRFLSISDCPWPLITVEYIVRDGNRSLVRRIRLKIDLCGFRNGSDRNHRILDTRQ